MFKTFPSSAATFSPSAASVDAAVLSAASPEAASLPHPASMDAVIAVASNADNNFFFMFSSSLNMSGSFL